MKNLLYLFLIGVLFSCGGSEDNETPIDNPTLDDKEHYWGFNVQDTTGLKVLGGGPCIYLNDTCTSICGVKSGKLWIGVFDSDSKNEKFTWTSSNEYDLTQTKDIGYGETVTIDIKNMHISYMYAQDNKNFRILFFSYKTLGQNIWNLLFVHDGKETFYRDAKYYEVLPWNDNYLMAINGDERPAKCSLFSEAGEKIYDVETLFLNGSLLFPNGWNSEYILQYIPINNSDFIAIYQEQDEYNKTYYIYKGDIQHSSYIWSNQVFETEYNAKCNYNTSLDGEKLTITINTVLYSGEKSTNIFVINIENGEITEL